MDFKTMFAQWGVFWHCVKQALGNDPQHGMPAWQRRSALVDFVQHWAAWRIREESIRNVGSLPSEVFQPGTEFEWSALYHAQSDLFFEAHARLVDEIDHGQVLALLTEIQPATRTIEPIGEQLRELTSACARIAALDDQFRTHARGYSHKQILGLLGTLQDDIDAAKGKLIAVAQQLSNRPGTDEQLAQDAAVALEETDEHLEKLACKFTYSRTLNRNALLGHNPTMADPEAEPGAPAYHSAELPDDEQRLLFLHRALGEFYHWTNQQQLRAFLVARFSWTKLNTAIAHKYRVDDRYIRPCLEGTGFPAGFFRVRAHTWEEFQ